MVGLIYHGHKTLNAPTINSLSYALIRAVGNFQRQRRFMGLQWF